MNSILDIADLIASRAACPPSTRKVLLLAYAADDIARQLAGEGIVPEVFHVGDGGIGCLEIDAWDRVGRRGGDGARVDLLGRSAVEMSIRRYGDEDDGELAEFFARRSALPSE